MRLLNVDTNRSPLRRTCPALRRPPASLRPRSRSCDTCSTSLTNFPRRWTPGRRKTASPGVVPCLVPLSSTSCSPDDLSEHLEEFLDRTEERKETNEVENAREIFTIVGRHRRLFPANQRLPGCSRASVFAGYR